MTPRSRSVSVLPALALALSLSAAEAAAQCSSPDDPLEDNDTCAAAYPVTVPFSRANLFVHRHDPDCFLVEVGPDRELDVQIDFDDAAGDIDVTLYDQGSGCGDLWTNLRSATSNSDDERIVWHNSGSTTRQIVVVVQMWRGAVPLCNHYDLTIDVGLHDPACHPLLHDDGLEPNDDCASARQLPLGPTPGLWANRNDEDFYRVRVDPGATLDVALHFDHGATDIDLFFYDAAGPCGGGYQSGELAHSYSATNDERAVWTNNGSAPVDVIVHVDVYPWHSCNDYDMVAELENGGLGTNYCTATPNASGAAGRMSARGSDRVADDDFVLEAANLPEHTVGYFLCSRQSANLPATGGGLGTLCVGGDVGRFDDFVLQSGSQGRFELRLVLARMPLPSGLVAVAPNDTWRFQAWFRDRLGTQPTSNFTDGLAVTFH